MGALILTCILPYDLLSVFFSELVHLWFFMETPNNRVCFVDVNGLNKYSVQHIYSVHSHPQTNRVIRGVHKKP